MPRRAVSKKLVEKVEAELKSLLYLSKENVAPRAMRAEQLRGKNQPGELKEEPDTSDEELEHIKDPDYIFKMSYYFTKDNNKIKERWEQGNFFSFGCRVLMKTIPAIISLATEKDSDSSIRWMIMGPIYFQTIRRAKLMFLCGSMETIVTHHITGSIDSYIRNTEPSRLLEISVNLTVVVKSIR